MIWWNCPCGTPTRTARSPSLGVSRQEQEHVTDRGPLLGSSPSPMSCLRDGIRPDQEKAAETERQPQRSPWPWGSLLLGSSVEQLFTLRQSKGALCPLRSTQS